MSIIYKSRIALSDDALAVQARLERAHRARQGSVYDDLDDAQSREAGEHLAALLGDIVTHFGPDEAIREFFSFYNAFYVDGKEERDAERPINRALLAQFGEILPGRLESAETPLQAMEYVLELHRVNENSPKQIIHENIAEILLMHERLQHDPARRHIAAKAASGDRSALDDLMSLSRAAEAGRKVRWRAASREALESLDLWIAERVRETCGALKASIGAQDSIKLCLRTKLDRTAPEHIRVLLHAIVSDLRTGSGPAPAP